MKRRHKQNSSVLLARMDGCSLKTAASTRAPTLAVLLFLFIATGTRGAKALADCPTVTALVTACSVFVTYGTPDPYPGTPCCDAMTTLNMIAEPEEDRRVVCGCVMGLIAAYVPNATTIAALPGFCGVSLGFSIGPNTDCNYL